MNKHLVNSNISVRDALIKLDELASNSILFIVENNKLIGTLTDGDLRRGFIKGLDFNNSILDFTNKTPSFIYENEYDVEKLEVFKKKNLRVIPVIDSNYNIIDIINFNHITSRLPLDAVLMAGGEGKRLRPLTENTPKPLIKVGDKPIIEYNIDRLKKAGVKNIHISINYLGEQIENYFGTGEEKNLKIKYIKEDKPLGTVGSILLADEIIHEDILLMNSDLLTNIDFVDFYKVYKSSGADMAVASTLYNVDIPYAILETDENNYVKQLKEKPKYSYYSNAGIYILNSNLIKLIPKNTFYDITDLMDKIISLNRKIITFPINGYWLDIGKHDDYKKAQEDIKHLNI